jgi:hypothetical protein
MMKQSFYEFSTERLSGKCSYVARYDLQMDSEASRQHSGRTFFDSKDVPILRVDNSTQQVVLYGMWQVVQDSLNFLPSMRHNDPV